MANGFSNGLVAYYEMGDTGDICGTLTTEPDLQAGVGSAGVVTGKSGNAREFDAIGDVSEGFNGSIDVMRKNPMVSWTISLWVKFNAQPTTNDWLAEQYDGVGNEGWGLNVRGAEDPDDFQIFYHSAAGTELHRSAGANIVAGNWYHVVAGYDADNSKLFIAVNGTRTEGAATNQITITGAVALSIGGWFASGSNFSNAVIDEVAVWTRAFTSSEITQLYASGNGVFFGDFDDGTSAAASEQDLPNTEFANEGPLFSRVMEVFDHLQANPRDTGGASVTIAYRQVPV